MFYFPLKLKFLSFFFLLLHFQEQQVYQPQTEAISPTPDDPKNDTSIRDSTIIRNAISKLEADIDITMKKLHRAKLSQVKKTDFPFLK